MNPLRLVDPTPPPDDLEEKLRASVAENERKAEEERKRERVHAELDEVFRRRGNLSQ